MPNRLIKESVCTSDNLDRLSWFEEAMFFRLIVNCDDYGRMDARPAIIRSRLFPLKTVTDGQIEKALQSLRSADMIDLYVVDGRSFLQMRTWEKHQQVRAKRSKYPAPVDGVMADDIDLQSSDIKCKQMKSNVPVIQSESESISESESNARGKRTRFVAPTIAECENFFVSSGGSFVQATRFHNYYEANGWRVGKNPMKDWKAAARGWISRDKEGGFGNSGGASARSAPPQEKMLRYSESERKATYSAAVVDFDEV